MFSFEFTGFLSHVLIQWDMQLTSVDYVVCVEQLAQVDSVGNALVAGYTYSSALDGNANAGSTDMFLMKFDAQGVHLWTRQRGGEGADVAKALQADWGAMSLVLESFPWRKSFRSMF